MTRARVALADTSLLAAAFPWLDTTAAPLAHYSAGVRDVWIGPPRRVEPPAPPANTAAAWLPAALLVAALASHGSIPAWAFMWAVCFALFFGCKWVTWRKASASIHSGVARSIAYLVAWVGMDAAAAE